MLSLIALRNYPNQFLGMMVMKHNSTGQGWKFLISIFPVSVTVWKKERTVFTFAFQFVKLRHITMTFAEAVV